MLSTFFTPGPVEGWESAARSDTRRFAAYFHALLDSGVYIAPSQFEAGFASTAHGDAEMDLMLDAAMRALKSVR